MEDDCQLIDLLLTWNWEFDTGFIHLLEAECSRRGLSFKAVSPRDVHLHEELIRTGRIKVFGFLDRASESETAFLPITEWFSDHASFCFNRHRYAQHASDKAAVHYDMINAGLQTPYTIIVPPYSSFSDIPNIDYEFLGERFIAKPAHGGGSEGVQKNLSSIEQIQEARRVVANDAFLLQSMVQPVMIEDRLAWFRCIYSCGEVFPCWWDVNTHVYTPIDLMNQDNNDLSQLISIPERISHTLRMDIFSTEIALTEQQGFVVVDYLNDPIDLRLKSETLDGVPDEIVNRISSRIAEIISKKKQTFRRATQFE